MFPLVNKILSRFVATKKEKTFSEVAAESLMNAQSTDPLDVMRTGRTGNGWRAAEADPIKLDISDFPMVELERQKNTGLMIGDAAVTSANVMDDSDGPISAKFGTSYGVPDQLQNWFMSQSFIGYQACALIAQHWLVDKACSMAGEDAIRNGWEIKALGDEQDLPKADRDRLRSFDIPFKLKANLVELERFKNIFGIRIAIFEVESDDPLYYEKPFNIDGVTKNSYKGISQVDPYWTMPMLSTNSTSNPSSMHFYEPDFWVISGKKYHRSHLVIARGPQPADILKPTYIFGGIPLTQRIYERVYAAERTANEAPLLSLSKRTTAIHVDVEKAMANQDLFEQKLALWVQYRDNHAVKVLGKEEMMEQFDTNLSDFDSIIMNQYQLCAAISKVPATKLLGTSPKGFNATGDFEMVSYHEELESIQEHDMAPLVERHYLLLGRSLGIQTQVEVVFEAVDSVTMQQQAELNDKKAETATKYVTIGSVSPEEVRQKLRDDKRSGFNRLSDEEAVQTPGMSPENLEQFQIAGAEELKGAAAVQRGNAALQKVQQSLTQSPAAGKSEPDNTDKDVQSAANSTPAPAVPKAMPTAPDQTSALLSTLEELRARLVALESAGLPDGVDLQNADSPSRSRTSTPSVKGTVSPSVAGAGQVAAPVDPSKHPKMKVGGLLLGIENPRGTIRQGMNLDGNAWSTKMPHHYGYIKHVKGADGDELDCFVGPNLSSDKVFVINQKDPSQGEFDEHKCMLGFDSPDDAKEAYHAAYSNDWQGFDGMAEMSMADFKQWINNPSNCTMPISVN